MDMLQQGLLVVVLAVGTLIAVMLAIITQRLARLLWQRSTCHTVPRGEMPATSTIHRSYFALCNGECR